MKKYRMIYYNYSDKKINEFIIDAVDDNDAIIKSREIVNFNIDNFKYEYIQELMTWLLEKFLLY